MPTPTNPDLYEKIKKEVYSDIPKHSLFRSAQLVKRYKEAGGTYKGNESKPGIKNWFNSKWISVNDVYHDNKIVPCGSSNTQKKYGEYPLCRPIEIVNKLDKPSMKKLIDAKNISKEKPIRSEKILKTSKYNVTDKYT
jgi:hypothetical protein